jgi:EmrB/QacA subfamily drug resistance transporter
MATDEAAAVRPALAAAIVVTAIPLFMATLDNLVVIFALPVIRTHIGGSAEKMQWVVNAYTLSYAALLMTAAALGDRFGRRRLFALGILLFTAASAASALAGDTTTLIVARAVQGAGAAAIMPLSLTLLGAAVPPKMRDVAVGIWGGISGLGVAAGPLISGAVVDGLSWQWIFWLNVPLGLLVVPFMWRTLHESRGPDRTLDPLGLLLAGGGVFAMIWAIIRSDSRGWSSGSTLGVLLLGVALLAVFVLWQARTRTPLMPLRLFRYRAFSVINLNAVIFSFGVFGSVFLLAQYFQVVQGLSALQSGIRTLPWTMVPMITAPLASFTIGRIGARVIVTTGLGLQAIALAWIAITTGVHVGYGTFVPAFVLAGFGLGMTLAPMATVVLSSTPDEDHGRAAGVNSTLRELGVALGVAVLSAVFAAKGGYTSGQSFVNGLRPALWVGVAVVALGTLFAMALPGPARRPQAAAAAPAEPLAETAGR